jgi:inhibitor of cysteine peptidase
MVYHIRSEKVVSDHANANCVIGSVVRVGKFLLKEICVTVLRTLAMMLLVGILLALGCAAGGVKEYTSSDQPIEVKVGNQFMITLDSNPTTGYKWEANFDQDMLKLVKSEFKQDTSRPGMVGVGGKEYFTFMGVKSGDTQIKLTYKRPWEQQTADAKLVTFAVTVLK